MLPNDCDFSNQVWVFFSFNKTSFYSVGVLHQHSLIVLLNISLQECVGVTNLNCIINTKHKNLLSLSPCPQRTLSMLK